MPKEKSIEKIEDLSDWLTEKGKELGMPDEDDDGAYTSECPACGWTGPMIETIFKDGEFYCPACDHMFVSRTD
jgi:transposase